MPEHELSVKGVNTGRVTVVWPGVGWLEPELGEKDACAMKGTVTSLVTYRK